MTTELLSCETCAYHRRRTGRRRGSADDSTWSECHRKPPTVVTNHHHDAVSVWPIVMLNDLCGEWSATFK